MPYWRETPKGYSTIDRDGERITVFWDVHCQGWKTVYDSSFNGPFPDLDAALSAAETLIGADPKSVDRSACVDTPPAQRHMAKRTPGAPPPQTRTSAGPIDTPVQENFLTPDRAARIKRNDEQVREQIAAARARRQDLERTAQAHRPKPPQANHQARAQVFREFYGRAKPAPTHPAWVSVLGLRGPGPWSLAQAKEAYRAAVRIMHPDRGGSEAAMALLNAAWEQAQQALS